MTPAVADTGRGRPFAVLLRPKRQAQLCRRERQNASHGGLRGRRRDNRASLNPNGGTQESIEARKENAAQLMGLLLENGAGPTAVREDGTPFLISIIKDHGILDPVLSICLDLEVRDAPGLTPLLAACAVKSGIATRRSIAAGAHLLAKDKTGMSALHWASRFLAFYSDSNERVDIPLAGGVPIDEVDKAGPSRLHYAVENISPPSP